MSGRRLFRAFISLAAAASLASARPPGPTAQLTEPAPRPALSVNSTADLVDANPGDGVCETQPGNGQCTLRAAVQEANALGGADSIHLPDSATPYLLTQTGLEDDTAAAGDLDITGPLTITGDSLPETIVDGNGLVVGERVFHIPTPGIAVRMWALTIRGGSAGQGAGIYNAGSLQLDEVEISRNRGQTGVGLYNAAGASAALETTHINRNQAQDAAGEVEMGAGIFNAGVLSLDLSHLTQNGGVEQGGALYNAAGATATLDAGQVQVNSAAGPGGAIYNDSGSALTLTGMTLEANQGSDGGAIYNAGSLEMNWVDLRQNLAQVKGAGLLNNNGTVIARRTTVLLNQVGAGSSTPAGGGLYNAAGSISLYASQVLSNTVPGAGLGGGVYNSGQLWLYDSVVQANQAENGAGAFNLGTLRAEGSLFFHNTARQLGGGFVNFQTAHLVNSTLSGNDAGLHGGGLYQAAGDMEMASTTVARNQANAGLLAGQSGSGGGVFILAGSAALKNTLLAENYRRTAGPTEPDDCQGVLTSNGHNLISSSTGCTWQGPGANDQQDLNPQLAPIGENGGPTLTHDLLAGSPAIDRGDEAGCTNETGQVLVTDQRGRTRTARCDIGAVEHEGLYPVPGLTRLSPAKASVGSSFFHLTLSGENFTVESQVYWGGVVQSSSYISSTQLSLLVSEDRLQAPGQIQVWVSNPEPGGGTSSALTFTILPVIEPQPGSGTRLFLPMLNK